jgi:hypothetical protein
MDKTLVDRLGVGIKIGDRVVFRAWQGSDIFFNGKGLIQNIDPFGNVYIEPDEAMTIEGEYGFFDATVLMISTRLRRLPGDKVDECSGIIGLVEHVQNGVMVGVSWLEKTEPRESKYG